MKQTSAEAMIIAFEAQLRIYSQPEKGDNKLKGETPKNQCEGGTRGNLAVTCQAMGGNCREPS